MANFTDHNTRVFNMMYDTLLGSSSTLLFYHSCIVITPSFMTPTSRYDARDSDDDHDGWTVAQ